uniref:Peptidase C14 caspase domain-containing protein n=1 Tax=Mucochytrium quahogii TaxID=96639 RepID=A0A7S2S7T5_9STRA|mmetsp:Transcript_25932/g.56360  ORF Transcript_25932/g.56360 Transcript_25932/m.56360 type:complete len:345 (+) Transcript_25932:1797-2831(+)
MNFFKKMADAAEDAIEERVDEFTKGDDDGDKDGSRDAGDSARAPEGAPEDFDGKVKVAIPGIVRMFSGCMDSQTSADVSNTASFELPEDAGPGGAGGACTNALIATLTKEPESKMTWIQILESMRGILSTKGYEQIPQLSSSRKIDVQHDTFSVNHPDGSGKRRAVLIGINYVGQRGELRGCHNDVISMKTYLETQGFVDGDMKVLMDDGSHENPTAKNIMSAIDWLVEGAAANDSLFLHYSGHGGYVTDESGDEKDGKDETLVPVDFQSSGQIIDDILFQELVMPVPENCQLTCVLDCCHSGTVLDLPYMIQATENMNSETAQMGENPGFSFSKLMKIAKKTL